MSGNCIEIGTIQAFLDGETSPEVSLQVSNHIAECDRCANLLATAEEETSVVFSALDREIDTLVPTQRLWSRINDSLTDEKSHATYWQKFLGFASIYLASPSFAVAVGLLIFVGLFAAFWTPQVYNSGGDVAQNVNPAPSVDINPAPTAAINAVAPTPASSDLARNSSKGAMMVAETKLPPEKLRALVTNADLKISAPRIQPQNIADSKPVVPSRDYLPGEESYVKTIAELRQNVDGQKDTALSPSSRVSFERDMAVVDDSIRKMRSVVRKNPKNPAAKQVLYSSYQDKIDLLNSVAQREDLVASLR